MFSTTSTRHDRAPFTLEALDSRLLLAAQTFSADLVNQQTSTEQTVTVQQFDPSLGTLTGVELRFVSDGTGNIVDYTASVNWRDGEIEWDITHIVTLSVGDQVLLTDTQLNGFTRALPDGVEVSDHREFSVTSADAIVAADGFVGTGTVSVDVLVSATGNLQFASGGNGSLSWRSTDHYGGQIQVVYTYDEAAPTTTSDASVQAQPTKIKGPKDKNVFKAHGRIEAVASR